MLWKHGTKLCDKLKKCVHGIVAQLTLQAFSERHEQGCYFFLCCDSRSVKMLSHFPYIIIMSEWIFDDILSLNLLYRYVCTAFALRMYADVIWFKHWYWTRLERARRDGKVISLKYVFPLCHTADSEICALHQCVISLTWTHSTDSRSTAYSGHSALIL